MAKLGDAIRLRDAALIKIRAEGTAGRNFVEWRGDNGIVRMILRTPFQDWRRERDGKDYQDALAAQVANNLPYGLDIWTAEGKRLNMEWDDQGRVEVFGFRRGAWEQKVLAWAVE